MSKMYGKIKSEKLREDIVDTVCNIMISRSTRYLDPLPHKIEHMREVAEHLVKVAESTSEQLKDKPYGFTSASWLAIVLGEEFERAYLKIPQGQL